MTVVNGVGRTDEHPKAAKPRWTRAQQRPQTKLGSYFGWKGVFDRTVAALLLVPGLPILILLVVLIRLTSRGPGIFRQARVGRDGRIFTMYKLRSMRIDAERGSGAVWAVDNDPRTTPIGRYLRKFHLDELPQLFNVVCGDMSLVGPRPERPEFVAILADALTRYEERLLVPPGVTGLAQVNLPPDTDLESVAKKLELDLDYVHSAGLWLDVRLLLCTFARLIKFGNPQWMRLLRVKRVSNDPHKYLRGNGSQICPKGGAMSASDLAHRIVEKMSDTVDGRLAENLEDTIADGNGHGKGDGGLQPGDNGNGHRQHPIVTSPTLLTGFHNSKSR